MTHQNLILTEKAIGRHTKRLQKELLKLNHEFKLSETQNMLSRILGMNNYHELKEVLKFENKEEEKNNEPKKQVNFPIIKVTQNELNNIHFKHFGVSLENAEKSFQTFCENGDIVSIEKYLNSENIDIRKYIIENSHYFLKIAASKNQLHIVKLLFSLPYCKLEDMDTSEITHILSWTDKSEGNEDVFNYIFHELKLPVNLDYKEANFLLGQIVSRQSLNTVKKFINDSRIKSLVDINWSTPSGIFFNIACNNKHALSLLKFFIKKYNMKIHEKNFREGLRNENIKFIKFIFENIDSINYSSILESKLELPEEFLNENNQAMTISGNDLSVFLDKNLLSLALNFKNNKLFDYLLHNKKLNINPSDHNFLAVENACYFCNIPALKKLLTYKDCENFISTNAQIIFDKLSTSLIYNKKELQYQMCKFLLEKYKLKVNFISKTPRNSKLYIYLTKVKETQ